MRHRGQVRASIPPRIPALSLALVNGLDSRGAEPNVRSKADSTSELDYGLHYHACRMAGDARWNLIRRWGNRNANVVVGLYIPRGPDMLGRVSAIQSGTVAKRFSQRVRTV